LVRADKGKRLIMADGLAQIMRLRIPSDVCTSLYGS
jgi:hypothetical protein